MSIRKSRLLFMLIIITLFSIPVSDWSGDRHGRKACSAVASEKGVDDMTVEELAEDYRALRRKKGHFGGGDWDDDLDRWGGRMHSVMTRLEKALGTPGHSESDVRRLMGEPDSIRREKGRTCLVYLWRGWHDYLFFECRDGKVKRSGWYFAWE
jgi:hypothetical protein